MSKNVPKRILVVDDDPDISLLLTRFLTRHQFETQAAFKGAEALVLLKESKFDVVLCDFRLPDMDGIEMLTKAKILSPKTAFIIITGYSDIKTAVKAIKMGAVDYVTKPIQQEEILATIKKATEDKRDVPTPATTPPPANYLEEGYIRGNSKKDKQVYKHIELVAPTDMSVIIHGETGTGKEFVARTIHRLSKRADKPFIAIDCGALPKDLAGSEFFGHEKGAFTGAINSKIGNFELADGGTLFLDEIGNLTYDIQVKLLRVLQEKVFRKVGGTKDQTTDVRIIVATNENLKTAVEEGRFREDLYHRLNEFVIEVAPLRDRRDDIMKFATHFLHQANKELGKNVLGFTDYATTMMQQYNWYGNLREVRNIVKRAVLLSQHDLIDEDDLPKDIVEFREPSPIAIQEVDNGSDLRSAAMVAERDAIVNALDQSNYNKTKAARLLNIDRKTLYNKLKSYNIQLD